MKDKWLWNDGRKWWYITKIEYIDDEQLVREISFKY